MSVAARTQNLTHRDPAQVGLQEALDALGDPVRRRIVRALAAHPDWTLPCGAIVLEVRAATRSHHFAVLRAAGLLEQRDAGPRRFNRLRRPSSTPPSPACSPSSCPSPTTTGMVTAPPAAVRSEVSVVCGPR